MSNRVNVNINANDFSRRGLQSLRRSMDRMQRDVRRAGGDIRFNVRVDPGASRREMRRLQRQLRGSPVTINTRLDPPTPSPQTLRRRIASRLGRGVAMPVRLTSRGMVAGVRGPLRSLGGLVSGTLRDGVGQGLVSGFKAGGPIGAAVLAAIILGSLSLIGAALSGLIITALGAAFVGVAGVSAAMSEEVKSKWASTLGTLKKLFADVGTPLIPVLTRALSTLESMAERAAPALKRAVEETAPATEKFIQSLMKGFESFGKAAFGPIMDAWNVFAPVFGEEWDEFMDELGNSFGDMADLVKEHPTEIAAALDVVFEAIDLLVDTVTFFGKTWVFIMQNVGDSIGLVLQIFGSLLNGAMLIFEGILWGASKAFGWIPGLGDKLGDAKTAFGNFREDVVGKLMDMSDAAYGWDDALNKMNRKRKLDADISSWESKLRTARESLKKTTSQKAKAKLEADIKALQDKISQAKDELASINGRVATTFIDTVYRNFRQGERDYTNRKATGGVIGAAASGGVRGNMTLVGEAGPELVQLPTGSRVRSNPDTRRIMGGGSGGNEVVLRLEAGTDDVSRMLLFILRKAIRVQGGDVQVVLGRG